MPNEQKEMVSSRAKGVVEIQEEKAWKCSLDLETGDLGMSSQVEEEDIRQWVEGCIRNE